MTVMLKLVFIILAWMMKLSVAIFAKLRRIFPDGGSSSSSRNASSGGKDDDENDPFKILGLNRKDNPTIEDATKARRKLALKWHPDRNIGNAEEATIKMQIINHAFHQIEKMLGGEDHDDDGDSIGEQSDTSSEHEVKYEDMSKSAKRRARKREKKQRYNEEREFEKEMHEEFAKFERAQRNAMRGTFTPESTSFSFASQQKKGVTNGKGKSKAAIKRARKRAKDKNMRCSSCVDKHNLSSGDNTTFHHIAPESRCEIKFKSKELIKSPIFTAIRARTYNLLLGLMLWDPCDQIPLPPEDENGSIVFVTPLMVASYLGDYTAADIIIRNAEDQWADMVLAKSRPGGFSCLSLAMDAKDISQQLCDESKAHLENATKLEDQDVQEKIIEQYSESLEMAKKLVERLASMEQFALEKKRKEKIRFLVKILVIGLVVIFCYQCWGVVLAGLRFGAKLLMYFVLFIVFSLYPVEFGTVLLVYYLFPYDLFEKEASAPASSPTPGIVKDGIDVFCSDGEECFPSGSTCTDGISEEFSCNCGSNLKYSCSYIH